MGIKKWLFEVSLVAVGAIIGAAVMLLVAEYQEQKSDLFVDVVESTRDGQTVYLGTVRNDGDTTETDVEGRFGFKSTGAIEMTAPTSSTVPILGAQNLTIAFPDSDTDDDWTFVVTHIPRLLPGGSVQVTMHASNEVTGLLSSVESDNDWEGDTPVVPANATPDTD